MPAVSLDAALSADSSVAAAAAMSWALGSSASADSVFTPPLLKVTRAFSTGIVANSVGPNPNLKRARPFASPIVANSSSTDAAKVAWALVSGSTADSQGSGTLVRARPLTGGLAANSVFAPAFMNSTDGLLVFIQANSQVVADMFNSVPLVASLVGGSTFTTLAGQPDVVRRPPANRPQPLPPPGNRPLRPVQNPPSDPQMLLSLTPSTRRRGL